MVEKNRIEFIDLAKGFCILLVVLGHTFGTTSSPWLQFCGFFRMPLYFFLSGLFFKKYDGFYSFFKKKTMKLLVPFLLFYIFICIPSLIFLYYMEHRGFNGVSSFFMEDFGRPNMGINYPIWFLFCLFVVNILFYLLVTISKYDKIRVLISSFFLGSVGFLMNKYNFYVCFWIDTALTALPFFAIGWFLNGKKVLLYGPFSRKDLSCLIMFLFSLFIVKFYHSNDYVINYLNNEYDESIIALYFVGFGGTLFVILLSKLIKRLPIISYLGRYSIVVLTTHMIYLFLIKNILFQLEINQNSMLVLILLFFSVILLSMPTIYFGIKYFPIFFAQECNFDLKKKCTKI